MKKPQFLTAITSMSGQEILVTSVESTTQAMVCYFSQFGSLDIIKKNDLYHSFYWNQILDVYK